MNRNTRDLVSLLIEYTDHIVLPVVIQSQFAGDDGCMAFCRLVGGKLPPDLVLIFALAVTDMEKYRTAQTSWRLPEGWRLERAL
jgi:hypothetical protein